MTPAPYPRMTLAEFVAWLKHNDQRIVIPQYEIRPCHCGDLNCRGWRLVPIASCPDATEAS
jgi:hypothetical protein